MKIGNWESGKGRAFIIAEIGSNHEGDFPRAQRIVELAAQAGADAVKFQVYIPEKLVHPDMPAMGHAATHRTQLERMKSLQFTHGQYRQLAKQAEALGIVWMASAFDEESVDLVTELSPCIKIASGEATNLSLIEYAASKGKPILISTGMADYREWEAAAACVPKDRLVLLHCVSLYPTPPENAGLFQLRGNRYGQILGYSDHTVGCLAPIVAVSMGAQVIEKHFTDLQTGRGQAPGDHKLSLNLIEFDQMVQQIRQVEMMLKPWDGERPDAVNRPLLRRDPVTGLRMGNGSIRQ